jgi:hypothetical protein
MAFLRVLVVRLLAITRWQRLEVATDEEIGSHLEQREREHRERGLSSERAREAARRDNHPRYSKVREAGARVFDSV